jgi:hypothetical protein
MGLLDDAIREHLELKRRRGADSHEVECQEQEALGPPVRGEFAPAPQDPQAAEQAEPALPPEHELPPEAVTPVEPEHVAEPAHAAEPEPEPEPHADLEGWLDEPDKPAAVQATTEYTPPGVEQPAEASAAEEAPPKQDPPEQDPPPEESQPGEDVLEETPEFLQETPEHERLWFEQKPPRDFDLDR